MWQFSLFLSVSFVSCACCYFEKHDSLANCIAPDWWAYPKQVDSLKAKLLEKLEQSLADLELKIEKIESAGEDASNHSQGGSFVDNHEVKRE